MKKNYILPLVLGVCLSISLVVNCVLASKLIKQKNEENASEVLAEESTVDYSMSELNIKARESFSISLYVNYDENTGKYEKGYELYKQDYDCFFSVSSDCTRSGPNNIAYGNYTLETRDELLDILCKYELHEYRPKANEDGQVVKTVIPYLVIINGHAKDTWLEVSNIDEFAAKMISLGDAIE